ncbi:beta-L-arabinofuranosidase domain-containing protein [Catenulispora yoronensis]
MHQSRAPQSPRSTRCPSPAAPSWRPPPPPPHQPPSSIPSSTPQPAHHPAHPRPHPRTHPRPHPPTHQPPLPSQRHPLHPTPYLRLPPGAIHPTGWLSTQLTLQLTGLTAHYPSTSHFLDYTTTGWIHPANVGWEEVPYWLRGFGDLAYVTGDSSTLSTTEQWITGILNTQSPDGFLGPTALRTSLNNGPDFWPYLPLLQALRSFYEYSGDSRILPALTSFFHYMSTKPGSVFSSSWISYRVADLLDCVFWQYNHTGDPTLLALADTIHTNSANWTNNIPTPTTSTSPRATANQPSTPSAPANPPTSKPPTRTTQPS